MSQNRPPPAFQEYAASMIAKVDYRILSLAQRGLLYSMRLECWVNHALPENPSILAPVLGFGVDEIKAALPTVMPFFVAVNGKIVSPELEDYRAYLEDIRVRQRKGGKLGADLTNGKRKPRKTQGVPGDSTPNPQPSRDSTRDSLVKSSPNQVSQSQPVGRRSGFDDDSLDSWVSDYAKASNGG